jgi:hypothetical protein
MKPTCIASIFLLGLSLLRADAPTSHDDSFTKEGLFKADVSKLTDTQLVVSPDMPLAPGNNVLWCGTLQLAWNEAEKLVGEKLRFTTPSAAADLLNQSDFTRSDLAPGSYVALADFERNHVEDKIRAALQRTFHGAASPELIPDPMPDPGPDDFVAYAYLYKNLALAHPFADQPLLFADHVVEGFGFATEEKDDAVAAQAAIYDFQSPDDFIVSLKTKSPQDELILAKVTPGATLQVTIQSVLDRMAHHAPEVAGGADMLAVPKLNFDLRRDFSELEGLILDPSPSAKIERKLVVAKAEQLVRFQLNEKGAILKSEATIAMRALAMRDRYRMLFDKPFLILLKEKESPRPYFALWVGNATLLVPKKSPGT